MAWVRPLNSAPWLAPLLPELWASWPPYPEPEITETTDAIFKAAGLREWVTDGKRITRYSNGLFFCSGVSCSLDNDCSHITLIKERYGYKVPAPAPEPRLEEAYLIPSRTGSWREEGYVVHQYADGSLACNCPAWIFKSIHIHKEHKMSSARTCRHVRLIEARLKNIKETREKELDTLLEQSRAGLNEGWKAIANLPQPKPKEEAVIKVHLLYNTNAGFPDGETNPFRHRPVNDYLCGTLKSQVDALLYRRFPTRARLDDFTRVPAEVTCRFCWQKIRTLTVSMGAFAWGMRDKWR